MKKQILVGILGVSLVAFIAIPAFALVGNGDQVGRSSIGKVQEIDGVRQQVITTDYECDNCYKSRGSIPECFNDHCRVQAGEGTCAQKGSRCVCRVKQTIKIKTGLVQRAKLDVTK